jgi:hypothetical protein
MKEWKVAIPLAFVQKAKLSYLEEMEKFRSEKVPIYKGCKNKTCFCTGDCKEVVGYRDKTADEISNFTY